MSRPLVVLLSLLLVAAIAVAFHFAARPEPVSNKPVVFQVKVEEPAPVQKPAAPPVENPAFAMVGQSKAELITKMGAPRSQMEANGVQILRYNDYVFKLKDGLVQSVDVAPKETHSDVRARVQSMPTQQTRVSAPVMAAQESAQMAPNPERYRYEVEDRVVRWTRTMSRNTREWYRPRSIEVSGFNAVTGWSNRYYASGSCEVYTYPHGWRMQNFEVYLQLNDQGGFKDADVSARN